MSTPTEQFNGEKCQQRNRLAARRDGVDAAPVLLLKSAPTPGDGPRLTTAKGTLPTSPGAALDRINAARGDQASPLTLDDIYLHYLEAANSNFIADRFMFLDSSTLRNIAGDADKGFAFMNSHRTGGLSHPSELPFGRTFAGRYELSQDESGSAGHRALVGFYMLRGIKPNGDGGPTTDDLHAMIDAGTVFDVSVGLFGGDRICDVCGENIEEMKPGKTAWDDDAFLCPHLPGTDREMTGDQKKAQLARGVKGGVASYSLVGANCGEVSAVFDGAVPGAGFRKALALSRSHSLTSGQSEQARHAYAPLLAKGDLRNMDSIALAIQEGFAGVLQRFGLKPQDEPPVPPAVPDDSLAALPPSDTAPPLSDASGLPDTLPLTADNPNPKENPMPENTGAVQTDSQYAAHEKDILTLCLASGITNAGKLAETLDLAKLGTTYAAEVRKDSKAQAVRCYGAEIGRQLESQCDVLPVGILAGMRDGWRAEADKKFGIGANGEAPARATAPKPQPQALSAELNDQDDDKPLFSKLPADKQAFAKKTGATTPEKQQAFAESYFEAKGGAN